MATSVFQFNTATFCENLAIRPNGNLILTGFLRDGDIFGLNPNAASPSPSTLATLPVNGSTGIAQLGDKDMYALIGADQSGANPMLLVPGTISAYVLDLTGSKPELTKAVDIPAGTASFINGLVSLPENKDILLGTDSVNGAIVRINLSTKKSDVVFTSPALKPTNSSPSRNTLGVNGAKIHDGFLYYTNSNLQTFGKVKYNSDGSITGPVTTIIDDGSGDELQFDDFSFDGDGNAYVAEHPNMVFEFHSGGTQTTVASNGPLKEPASVALTPDFKKAYIALAGAAPEFLGGVAVIDL